MDIEENKKNLKILLVSTEAFPYVSVGGVGSVVSNLSKELSSLGHQVAVFIPKFGSMDEKKYPTQVAIEGIEVPTDDSHQPSLICNIKYIKEDSGVTFYFLENQEYYEKRANVYGYSDDPTRFMLLSRGVLEFIKLNIFVPDVIHCNDWHTGAVPNYMYTEYKEDPVISKICSVFTIHNLAYQGMFDHKHVSDLNFDDGRSKIESFFSSRLNSQNFMRRGIMYADAVNTVSRTYSQEILTTEFGEGLDKLLLELRGKLFGIINGISYETMNPTTDSLIEKTYTIDSLDERIKNKRALQREFGLEMGDEKFVIGFVGRLDFQKGLDLGIEVVREVISEHKDVQFVQIGGGDWTLVDELQKLKKDYPSQVGIHPYPNFTLPRLIFSGSDVMIYPSRFEPCGIVQLEAMRYGCLPIVRRVGGLADTVQDANIVEGTGTGFVFDRFSPFSLYGQIIRAKEIFRNTAAWRKMQRNAMTRDFSWGYSAQEYEKLYFKCCELRHGVGMSEKSYESFRI